MVAKKNLKIDPIGDLLSPETAFIQASNILDVATALALESRDVEGLTGIAAVYSEIGSRLMQGPASDEDEPEDEEKDKPPIGFRPSIVQEVKEVELND